MDIILGFVKEVKNRLNIKTIRADSDRNLEVLCFNPVNSLYEHGGEVRIKEVMQEISDEGRNLTKHVRSEVIEHIKYSTLVNKKLFDANPNILHFENGYYNTITKKFREGHTSDYLSSICQ
jgi:phage/plasmid-associated DNA primase